MGGQGDNCVRRSLLSKGFVLASAGYFFIYLSVSMFYLFPLFLDHFHPTKSRMGLIMGIHSVTAILVRPFFGRILDKEGGRKVTIFGLAIMIATMPGFYLVGSAGMLALALRAVNGIGWGIATTAMLAMCSDLAPADRMAQSLGIIGVAGIVSQAFGPTLAEEILRHCTFTTVFTVSLIMLAASLLCIMIIREAHTKTVQSGIRRPSGISAYPFLILLLIAAMPVTHGAVRGTVLNFIALFAKSIGFGRVGPFFLAFSAAAIITRLGLGDISDRYGRKRVILPAALVVGLNLLWIARTHSYWTFVASGFVAGLGQGLIFPALSTYLIDFLGHENKGLAIGLYLSLFDVGMGLGSPVFGWISDVSGYRQMYTVAGCLILLLTVIFSLKAPVIKTGN
jgi:MFS family permease